MEFVDHVLSRIRGGLADSCGLGRAWAVWCLFDLGRGHGTH